MEGQEEQEEQESTSATADLYRLAHAAALLRLYRESTGQDAPSVEALAAWKRDRPTRVVQPDAADIEAVRAERPDLAALANGSNPDISGDE